ncbi:MAG: glutaredoxin family protein [Casimicrobiaceae bacterium]
MKKVVVFHGNGCSACHDQMQYLQAQNIEFTSRNVSTDFEARKLLIEMGSKTVPTTLVDDEIVVGFDRERLASLLGV